MRTRQGVLWPLRIPVNLRFFVTASRRAIKVSEFSYELPKELIAQQPLPERTGGRLMLLDGTSGAIEHMSFSDFPSLTDRYDIVVLNDTRVIPARLFGAKQTGGRAELLIERVLDDERVLAQLKVSKAAKKGSEIEIQGHSGESEMAEVLGREGEFYELRFREGVSAILDRCGHVPLPPYIERDEGIDLALDRERYQTVFAAQDGGVAAPTAGLHFDRAMLDVIRDRGAYVDFCTLHVGAGTFQPVRTENVEDHSLHAEKVEVSDRLVKQIGRAWGREGRVIAVGTTTVRALESAAQTGVFGPFCGETNLFAYPGFEFRIVDAMVTNFHLPESSLLMLTAAFAGKEHVMNAYREAVKERYRFARLWIIGSHYETDDGHVRYGDLAGVSGSDEEDGGPPPTCARMAFGPLLAGRRADDATRARRHEQPAVCLDAR